MGARDSLGSQGINAKGASCKEERRQHSLSQSIGSSAEIQNPDTEHTANLHFDRPSDFVPGISSGSCTVTTETEGWSKAVLGYPWL